MVRYYKYTAYKNKWWYIAIKQWLDTKLHQIPPFHLSRTALWKDTFEQADIEKEGVD